MSSLNESKIWVMLFLITFSSKSNFELYENVYYKNEEYIINKINKGTIEVINLNTSQYETISCDLVYKKNNENENKYYIINN